MKILVTGNGKSGSWIVRGEQLGRAIGADVNPSPRSLAGYDAVVLVKRYFHDALRLAHAHRVPVVYDIVDAWQTSLGNDRSRSASLGWLRNTIGLVVPSAIVTATKAMLEDCAPFGLPMLALPHHVRPGQKVNPIRDKVTRVGYQGSERYVIQWRPLIERACRERGWQFVMNPVELADVDIALALRDDDGYPAQRWKSNVKLANCQGTGTPCILAREMGYMETATGAERWASDADELGAAMDDLAPQAARVDASEVLRSGAIPLERVAGTYKEWLWSLKF